MPVKLSVKVKHGKAEFFFTLSEEIVCSWFPSYGIVCAPSDALFKLELHTILDQYELAVLEMWHNAVRASEYAQ